MSVSREKLLTYDVGVTRALLLRRAAAPKQTVEWDQISSVRVKYNSVKCSCSNAVYKYGIIK